jgi:type IV secretory pathway VirB10-like protein
MRMPKTLLTTAAAVAVVGLTVMAAQAQSAGDTSKAPAGAQEQKAPVGGGAMNAPGAGTMKPQGAENMKPQGAGKTPAQSAQGAQSVKPEQRMGDEQKQTTQKGAQEQSSTEQKGAQDKSTQKSGANATEQHANQAPASGKAAVQLSATQRSKIQATIGKNPGARVTTNVDFNIAVGAMVPHDVHVVVLPEDVVEIVPQYEGFDYIIVGDEILIIDPNTMDIVDIIPA